mmetsp:Transcript_93052/g.267715  ORF Transcript_93052/g.267715 Transcript_93052/m.267715 type:complete len:246 (+) Transcript_93052:231-968(+)
MQAGPVTDPVRRGRVGDLDPCDRVEDEGDLLEGDEQALEIHDVDDDDHEQLQVQQRGLKVMPIALHRCKEGLPGLLGVHLLEAVQELHHVGILHRSHAEVEQDGHLCEEHRDAEQQQRQGMHLAEDPRACLCPHAAEGADEHGDIDVGRAEADLRRSAAELGARQAVILGLLLLAELRGAGLGVGRQERLPRRVLRRAKAAGIVLDHRRHARRPLLGRPRAIAPASASNRLAPAHARDILRAKAA